MSAEYFELNIKRDIQNHYRGQYEADARRQQPWLRRLENATFIGGLLAMGVGVAVSLRRARWHIFPRHSLRPSCRFSQARSRCWAAAPPAF